MRIAYPISWRVFDVLEALARTLMARRLSRMVPYLMLLPALLAVGVLVLGLFVLAEGSLHTLDVSTFHLSHEYSFANYERAFTEPLFRNIAIRSLVASLIVTAVTLCFAFPYAYLMVRTKSASLRKWLLIILFLPFFMGQVVRAFGWVIILGNHGLMNSLLAYVGVAPQRMLFTYSAVIFGLVQYMLPFAILTLAPALTAIPEDTEAAAESLGANWIRTFVHILLPMARPGLIGAALVVMTLSLTDLAMPAILGGGANDFIANAVYDQFFLNSDQGLGAALALLHILLGSVLVGIVATLFRGSSAKTEKGKK